MSNTNWVYSVDGKFHIKNGKEAQCGALPTWLKSFGRYELQAWGARKKCIKCKETLMENTKRNRSPFAELNALKEANVRLINTLFENKEVSDDELKKVLSEFKEATKSSSNWLMRELFDNSKCLPYNKDVVDDTELVVEPD